NTGASRSGPVCRPSSTTRSTATTRIRKKSSVRTTVSLVALLLLSLSAAFAANVQPTFYKDVLPILQSRCQGCHREGEMAPMPLETYRECRLYAQFIRHAIEKRTMPPWFADPCCGRFSNDPSLTREQIDAVAAWADAHAPEGNPADAPPPPHRTKGWNIDRPDLVLQMPAAKQIPASGDVPYQYIIIPTHFKTDRWVRMSEIRPSNRMAVHHAVAYIRAPKSS